MLDFVVGAFMGPQDDQSIARGWIGLNGKIRIIIDHNPIRLEGLKQMF